MFPRQQPGTFIPGLPGFPGQQDSFFWQTGKARTAGEQARPGSGASHPQSGAD